MTYYDKASQSGRWCAGANALQMQPEETAVTCLPNTESRYIYLVSPIHTRPATADLLEEDILSWTRWKRLSGTKTCFELFEKGRSNRSEVSRLLGQLESSACFLVGSGDIQLDTFIRIFKNKGVTNRLLRVLDTEGNGYTSADAIMEFLATVSSSRPRAGFDQRNVDHLEQLFKQVVGDQKEITREQFKTIHVSKNTFFTERVFDIFDEDHSGTISLQEFIAAVHTYQTPDDKLQFLFRVYDKDGDGLIQHRELHEVMDACMKENGMEFSKEQLLELTSAMFEDADTENRGAITLEALRNQLAKHEGLLEHLTISIESWLVPPPVAASSSKTLLQRLSKLKPYQLSLPYFKNNYVFLSYLAAFFLVNIGLFVSRAYEYRHSNGFVILARACGE
ncbi:hypothetical protein evm_010969 [Chilo suppressalis]|nr:hypothetical protein evm_010969 [Chilo suppressalis]